MTNLQSFQNYAESCGCDHSDDKKKKSKITKEEIIKEYGDPTVSKRLKVARAIDSTFRGKPKYNSKRAKISNALKMSSIKAETKKRQQKENPYSVGKKVKMAIRSMSEEGYDRYKDNIVWQVVIQVHLKNLMQLLLTIQETMRLMLKEKHVC